MFLTVSISAMFLVFARATLGDETCVCYVGQELDRTSGKRYGWSLPEQTLCECTEFRLGGVNMKPQVQPNEIERGIDSPTHAPGLRAPVPTQTPCSRSYTTEPRLTQVEEPLDLPMRLEFSVQGRGEAYVDLSPGSKGRQHAPVAVGLTSSSLSIWKQEVDNSWSKVKAKSNLRVFGEPLFVTYSNGHIEAGVRDVETSYMTFDLPSTPQADRVFIVLENSVSTEWRFFEPCTYFTLTWLGKQ